MGYHQRKFRWQGYRLLEAIFLVERRTLLSWTRPGPTRRSTSSPSWPGRGWESPRSSTTGCDGWLLNSIALHNSFLAVLSTDRAPLARLRLRMNFLRLLSIGLEI